MYSRDKVVDNLVEDLGFQQVGAVQLPVATREVVRIACSKVGYYLLREVVVYQGDP
jgi:hypothetical protein